MATKREVLAKLLVEAEHFLQHAQTDTESDPDSLKCAAIVKRNVARIQRLLVDADALWTLGVQQVSR